MAATGTRGEEDQPNDFSLAGPTLWSFVVLQSNVPHLPSFARKQILISSSISATSFLTPSSSFYFQSRSKVGANSVFFVLTTTASINGDATRDSGQSKQAKKRVCFAFPLTLPFPNFHRCIINKNKNKEGIRSRTLIDRLLTLTERNDIPRDIDA